MDITYIQLGRPRHTNKDSSKHRLCRGLGQAGPAFFDKHGFIKPSTYIVVSPSVLDNTCTWSN